MRATPWAGAILTLALATASGVPAGAHKPITSPFMYAQDVLPIVHQRCGRCHSAGGVAPMSLLTYESAVPWGESMRLELMAGHMPPWSVDRGAARFRNPGGVTARELNVLLTWVTGGTPTDIVAGDDRPAGPSWSLGTPDTVVQLPPVTLGVDEKERTAEFTIGSGRAQRLRAVDLLPGTRAIVRSATIEVAGEPGAESANVERRLSLWVPGDDAVAVERSAFAIPAGRSLLVKIRYRKTWEYEHKAMADQSRVGLYFAPSPAPPVKAVTLTPGSPVTLARDAQALAIYPDAALADVGITVTATRPSGQRDELMAFHPRAGWARRYWFREPVPLPRGTRLEMRVTTLSPALLPPGITPPKPPAPPAARVTVNFTD
jgi:hypothetical protein